MKEILNYFKNNPAVASAVIPVLLTGVFAAASATFEMYRAYMTDSKWGQSHVALEQKALWEHNVNCMQGNKFSYITNDHNVQIGTIICPTGDVLISAQRPDDKHPSFKWVSWDNISTIALDFSLFSKAHANTVINTYYSKEGQLVKEVVDNFGYCTRYYINPFNGQVTYSEPC